MNKKKIYECVLLLSGLALMMIQRFALGIVYKPVIDDWFLYGDTYKSTDALIQNFIIPNGKFSIRPMAGLTDIFFIRPLFSHLWAAQALMTILLFTGVIMICKVLRKNTFSAGGFFIIFMCMLPLNLEAVYWLAAAVRNCCSVFFIGLSSILLQNYIETNKKGFIISYMLIGFITVSYYEPAAIMYMLLSGFLIFRNRKPKLIIIPAAHLLYISAYYIFNIHSPALERRGKFLMHGFWSHAGKITKMSSHILGKINIQIFSDGMKEGIELIFNDRLIMQVIIIIVCSVLSGLTSNYFLKNKKADAKRLLYGVAALCSAMSLFYIIEDTRITIRTVYFSFAGIAIIAEELLLFLPRKPRFILNAAAVTVLSVCCGVAGIGAVHLYSKTSETDAQIATELLNAGAWQSCRDIKTNLYLLNSEPYYDNVACTKWFEHIRGVCSGNSELTGCMRHISGISETGRAIPLCGNEEIKEQNIYNYNFFILDNIHVQKLHISNTDNAIYMIDENGQRRGQLVKSSGGYIFSDDITSSF